MLEISQPIFVETAFGRAVVRYVAYDDGPGHSSQTSRKEGVVITSPKGVSTSPLVRLQSSCLFGEAFWATDCDCGSQLSLALERILSEQGVLVYFYEEGRGAGLKLKVEAIRLQQTKGMETDAAFECLRLEPDLRTYRAAAAVLSELIGSERSISLLTNNPNKKSALEARGVKVEKMITHVPDTVSKNVASYLLKKSSALGHVFPEEMKENWRKIAAE